MGKIKSRFAEPTSIEEANALLRKAEQSITRIRTDLRRAPGSVANYKDWRRRAEQALAHQRSDVHRYEAWIRQASAREGRAIALARNPDQHTPNGDDGRALLKEMLVIVLYLTESTAFPLTTKQKHILGRTLQYLNENGQNASNGGSS